MTAEERAERAVRDSSLKRSKRRMYEKTSYGNIFLMLGNMSHWLKEFGYGDAFAVGTVFLVPIGLIYMGEAGFWLLRHLYLTWKEE